MTLLQAFILGIVQGTTEFLPISSSGHLVLIPWLLGWKFDQQTAFVFDILVQWGTLLAVIIYFWRDLITLAKAASKGLAKGQPWSDPDARLAWLLLAASIPAAIAGSLFKDMVANAFDSPTAVCIFLLGTAVLLFLSEYLSRKQRFWKGIRFWDAICMGLFQALALFPGISRSGTTISGGLFRGLRRPDAAHFSFLMAVPVMIGAGGIALIDLAAAPNSLAQVPSLAIGFLAAAAVGYFAIGWLLDFLGKHSLIPFACYCTVVGLGGLILNAFGK
jgi:undecaprenyl-diphosphatase